MIKNIIQFSIHSENKEGVLADIISQLGYNGVNIRSVMIVDHDKSGEIRLIVNDPIKAERIFKEENISFEKNSIIAVRMPDKPGSLHYVASILASNNINIDYVYPVLATTRNATVCFKTKDQEKTIQVLQDNGIAVTDQDNI